MNALTILLHCYFHHCCHNEPTISETDICLIMFMMTVLFMEMFMVNYILWVFHINQRQDIMLWLIQCKMQWFLEFCFRKYTSEYAWHKSILSISPVFTCLWEMGRNWLEKKLKELLMALIMKSLKDKQKLIILQLKAYVTDFYLHRSSCIDNALFYV